MISLGSNKQLNSSQIKYTLSKVVKMKITKSVILVFAILLTISSRGDGKVVLKLEEQISVQGDPCYEKYHDEASCNADNTTGGGCVWCKCAALPSSCFTKDDATHLPPSIYDCAKKDMFNRIIEENEELDNVLIEIIH